mgnify:FL=1
MRKKKIFSLFYVTSLPALRLIDKMENDETHIIHRILKGETSLYEYFLDKYSQQVFILIIRIVENQEDAEELTQDTFLKAFEHLSSFKAESSFSTWIYRIAYNTAISATRKKKQELISYGQCHVNEYI